MLQLIWAGWQAPGLGPMPPERERSSDLPLCEGWVMKTDPSESIARSRRALLPPSLGEPLCSRSSGDTRPGEAQQDALIHRAPPKHPERSANSRVGVHLEMPSGCFVRLFTKWGGGLRQLAKWGGREREGTKGQKPRWPDGSADCFKGATASAKPYGDKKTSFLVQSHVCVSRQYLGIETRH